MRDMIPRLASITLFAHDNAEEPLQGKERQGFASAEDGTASHLSARRILAAIEKLALPSWLLSPPKVDPRWIK
jgi:hypothetical protein